MKRVFLIPAVAALLLCGAVLAGHQPCEAELDDCLTQMTKKFGEKKGWVGIELEHEEDGTLTITRVVPESPAERAGLRPGDRIVALNGVSYAGGDRAALKQAYRAMVPDNTITYTVERGGEQLSVDVLLVGLPDRIKAQWIARHLVEGHSAP